jgi:hypothetical protein
MVFADACTRETVGADINQITGTKMFTPIKSYHRFIRELNTDVGLKEHHFSKLIEGKKIYFFHRIGKY